MVPALGIFHVALRLQSSHRNQYEEPSQTFCQALGWKGGGRQGRERIQP